MAHHYSIQHFSDAHEHGRSIANLDQDYFQIEAGAFQSALMQVDLDGVHVFSESANRKIAECGQALPGSVVLGWLAPTKQETRTPAFSLKRGGEDWMFHLPRDTRVVGLTVPAVEFEGLTEHLARRPGHLRFLQGAAAFSALRSGIEALCGHADRLAVSEVRQAFRKQVLNGIFGTLAEAQMPRSPDLTRLTYSDIVRRCQDLVQANPQSPPSVLDLCVALRLCRRTVQKSFMQVTGQSPSSYLRHIRLSRVRQLLRTWPDDRMTVGEAAARWGFFHLGNFAHDYQRLFGELPSQTLGSRVVPCPRASEHTSR